MTNLVPVQNITAEARDLPLGEVNHYVEPQGIVKVPADVAASLLEQTANWGPVKATKIKKESDN